MSPQGFSQHAERTPDKPALIVGGSVRTYGEVDARTDRLAAWLADRGIGEQDRVAGVLPNGFAFFEVGLAAGKLGALVVPINWHLKAEELAYVLEDSDAGAVVTDSRLAAEVEPALEQLAAIPSLVLGAGDGQDRDYETALAAVDDPPDRHTLTTGSPVLYTSGTTGRPKGVVHGYMVTDETIAMGMDGQIDLWDWSADDVYLCSGPAYHASHGGWAMVALYVGATTVVLPEWDAREWLRLVDEHAVTRTFMVPAHFIRVLEVPEEERAGYDTSSLSLVVHAAAPCPVSVKRRIMAALPDTEIHELYGASEGGATRIGPDEWRERPGSVGTPWPGVEVHVLDEEGEELPPGEDGLVHIRPRYDLQFHYHDDKEKTDDAWRGELFTIGDVGHLDEDGYLYLTDRASDLVIRGGVNIYPRQIEEVLHRQPGVVDCAVFGVPDERMGEELMAVVEGRVDPAAVRDAVRGELADFKVPRYVELVDTLPRNPNGKVMKRYLRQRHWEDQPSAITTG